ncbi:MAG: YfhO family protein [Bacilli bacterium]|nr:YfhO family protein [Bacilli bacterium]
MKKNYLITIISIVTMLIILFVGKEIFPFGSNSLIWGDMHDQVTSFYYKIYDTFKGNSSLLIDFTSSGGINFLGILAYYVLSPFSLLVLLFSRSDIYLVVSIIIALKVLASGVTFQYLLNKLFKNIPWYYSSLLSIMYAFNAYNILMYQITPWIDIVYLFPIIIVGLKKVLDNERTILYSVTLAISLICCFYLSLMMLIFIFLISLIYILVYKKDKIKESIVNLGIYTIPSLLISSFIIIPSYKEISISSRLGIDISKILNSHTGPITDKIVFFILSSFLIYLVLKLIKNYKDNKKFLLFLIPSLLITMIPIIIEPVNKILHFGSYAFFTNRFGFISQFLLLIGGAYLLNNSTSKEEKISRIDSIKAISLSIISSVISIILIFKNYQLFQKNIYTLTISGDKKLIIILLIIFLINLIAIYLIDKIKINKKIKFLSFTIIIITQILCSLYIYVGIDFANKNLNNQYIIMNNISKDYQENDYFRLKNDTNNIIMNSSLVTKFHNLDHFTSLTDENTLNTLKKLGYSSMWVKTFSKGGTLFTDVLLGNKYLLSTNKKNYYNYEFTKKYGNLYFYKSNSNISYGYYIDDHIENFMNENNSFEIQNKIYKSITKTNDNLFDIYNDYKYTNIKKAKIEDYTYYKLKNKDNYAYIEKNIDVKDQSILYLEVLKSLKNSINAEIYEKMNIYVNDKLYAKNYPSENNNGTLNLGIFKNQKVNIKIEIIEDIELQNITISKMDISKYNKFIKDNYNEKELTFNKNTINIKINSNEEKIIFIPINYSKSYDMKNNDREEKLEKVFNNYIGINLHKGVNDITIKYVPDGLKIGIIFSLIGIMTLFVLNIKSVHNFIINNNIIKNLVSRGYIFIYISSMIAIYIIPIIAFILSYFITL